MNDTVRDAASPLLPPPRTISGQPTMMPISGGRGKEQDINGHTHPSPTRGVDPCQRSASSGNLYAPNIQSRLGWLSSTVIKSALCLEQSPSNNEARPVAHDPSEDKPSTTIGTSIQHQAPGSITYHSEQLMTTSTSFIFPVCCFPRPHPPT